MEAEPPRRLKLGPRAVIRMGRDFARVRREGGRLILGCLVANWRKLPAGSRSRVGLVASGRIGGAVVRNRARRLLRESFRLHQHELAEPLDLVLVARASIADRTFVDVEKDFLTALRKARLLRTRD